MSKDQKGFIVYGDIKAVIDELTDEQKGQLFQGMVDYFVTGKAPKFTGVLKFVFIPIQQQMNRDIAKYDERCEKMRANANKRWKDNAIAYNGIQLDANDANTNTKTNTNTKKDKDTNTMSAGTDAFSLSRDLIQYLNEKAGTSYKSDGAITAHIQFWLNNGYTPLQLRTVIDKKCGDWLNDDKMRGYLRPSTLFGDKFPEYLAAPISLVAERQKKAVEDRAALEQTLSEKQQALSDLKDSLPNADKTERRALREQIAILEDSIGLIERRLS